MTTIPSIKNYFFIFLQLKLILMYFYLCNILLFIIYLQELGRHRGREGKTECSLCGNECENVSHVLWECSAYSSTRASFMKKLQELLEDDYEDFESLDNVEKSSYVLGSELWESKFDGLLALVKEYIVDVW